MPLLTEIHKRYSCRAYQDKPIEQEVLDRVLEAARLAPSARNMQEWRFVIVRDPQLRQRMQVAANNQPFVAAAPVIVAACEVSEGYTMRCGQKAGPIDTAIALEHIALQAAAEGLGTCWIGSFYPDQVREVLQIPRNVEVVELMTMGYPADQPRDKKREPIDRIACYDKWSF